VNHNLVVVTSEDTHRLCCLWDTR